MKLYYMNIHAPAKEQKELLAALGNRAPACYAEVQKKVNEYRQEKDRFRSLFAYLLLAYAYELQPDGLCVKDMPDIARMAKGKPFFKGERQLHFNLSHSGDYVVCAISDDVCGVDIQENRTFKEQFAKRFFSEKEQKYMKVALFAGRSLDAIGTEIWCKKESLAKCRGYGLTMGTQILDTEECAEQIGVVHALAEEGYTICYCSCSVLKESAEIYEVKCPELVAWLCRD